MIGGLSMTELMIILGLALLLLGPDQLPTIARTLGKGIRELRKATDDIKGQFESEIARIDLDDTEKTRRMIGPVPTLPSVSPESDPGAARALARSAAVEDPGAARAAARRDATSAAAPLKLVAPEGTVPSSAADSLPAASDKT